METKMEKWVSSRAEWGALLGIVLLVFVVYGQSLSYEFTNWDDQIYVTANPLVTNFSADSHAAIWQDQVGGNHHPLTVYSLILDWKWGGGSPFAFHFTNLIFHALNIILLFFLLRLWFPDKFWLRLLTLLIFALHPMHVESVAWISERKDVLYVFFLLSGLISWQNFRSSGKYLAWGLTLILFVLSMLAKPAAVIFPLLLLLVDYLQKRRFSFAVILEKLPFFLLALLMGLWTLSGQSESGTVDTAGFSVFEKLLFAAFGLFTYAWKLVLPLDQSAFYPFPESPDAVYYAAALVVLLGGAGTVFLHRISRIPVFGILFYLISLLLVLQFISIGNTVIAERYTYLAYIGPGIALGFGLEELWRHRKIPNAGWMYGLLGLLGIAMSVLSYQRVQVWENSGTLWTSVIESGREAPVVYHNRGLWYQDEEKYKLAIADFKRAVELNPQYRDAWYNLGNVEQDAGNNAGAKRAWRESVQIDPTFGRGWNNLGSLALEEQNPGEALDYLNHAVAVRPGMVEARINLGMAKSFTKDYMGAIAEYDEAIRLDPSAGQAWLFRSYTWKAMQRLPAARSDALQAKTLGTEVPPEYLNLLGIR